MKCMRGDAGRHRLLSVLWQKSSDFLQIDTKTLLNLTYKKSKYMFYFLTKLRQEGACLSTRVSRPALSMAGRSLTAAAGQRHTTRAFDDEAHGRGSSHWTVVLAAGAVLGLVVAFMQLSGGHDIRAQAEADARRRGNMYRPNGHPDMVRARRRARRREREAMPVVEDEAVPLGHGLGRTGPPVHKRKSTTPWLWQGDTTATSQPQPPQPPPHLQAQLAQQARRDREVRDRLLATATATAGLGRPPMEQANAAMLGLSHPSPEAARTSSSSSSSSSSAAAATSSSFSVDCTE